MSFALADIGDALKTSVQGFATGATVRRVYVWDEEFGDLSGLDITVVMPRTQDSGRLARKKDLKTAAFDIVFRKKLEADPHDAAAVTTEVDGLLEDVEAVALAINGLDMDVGQWTGEVTQEELYDHGRLREMNQFKSILTVQYQYSVEART